mmetsp:Transcript_35789/g.102863  ORF Transcript_35789/g.102863 Transcript_35789/m.102863 type:complete len:141 (-) Transcript_35789:69-491(-)
MLSTQIKKNPNLRQRYWAEVCCREDRSHVFHPEHSTRLRERQAPESTAQSSFHGGQGLVHTIPIDNGANSYLQQRPTTLSSVGRSTFQATGTPRGSAGATLHAGGSLSARGWPGGLPASLQGGRALRTGVPDERRLPAGV